MDKCNVDDDDDLISVSSDASSTVDQDKDASTLDTPEADVDVETLFSDIEVLTFYISLFSLNFLHQNLSYFVAIYGLLSRMSQKS